MSESQRACFLSVILAVIVGRASATDWVRPGVNTNQPVWGVRGGLLFAIHPGGFSGGEGGPRGLIRLGYPTLTNAGYDLINFIAIEPVVRGKRGFSELEQSALDRCAGKRFWVKAEAGQLTSTNGLEQLEVTLFVERFDHGAHVRLRLRQRSDAPGEWRLAVEAESGSAPLDECILTATMGNKARTRQLWLRDGPVSSLKLYPDYAGLEFAPHRDFALEYLPRTTGGDVLVAVTTDEAAPWEVQPFGRPSFWDYRGNKVTQYWRKPAAAVRKELRCTVNGRFTYWGSKRPIPGGVAFENFELGNAFRAGDAFVFGITRRAPAELAVLGVTPHARNDRPINPAGRTR
jgi:hypothetical protein